MARRTQKKPEVPGAAADPQNSSPPSGEDTGAGAQAPVVDTPAAPSAVAASSVPLSTGAVSQTMVADKLKDEEAKRQADATKDLVGSPAAIDWGHLTEAGRMQAQVAGNAAFRDPNEHLPAVGEVNWARVPAGTDKILTKSGWLLRP